MVGNAFTQSFADWRTGTYEYFKDWASKQFNAEDQDSDDDDDVPVQYQKAKDIPFKKNKRGDIVVPPITDYRTVRQRQRVIRGYLGAVYREFECFDYLFISDFSYRGIHWKFDCGLPLPTGGKRRPNYIFSRLRSGWVYFKRPRSP